MLTVPVVIYTRKNFYLIDALNDLIESIKAAGLFDFWTFEEVDNDFLKQKDTSVPKVLTTFHLIGCFHVLLTGCLVSLLIFLCELLVHKLGGKASCMIKYLSQKRIYRNC